MKYSSRNVTAYTSLLLTGFFCLIPLASAEVLNRDHYIGGDSLVSTKYQVSCDNDGTECHCKCLDENLPSGKYCASFKKTPTAAIELLSLLRTTDPDVIEEATYGTCEHGPAGAFLNLDSGTCAIDLGNPKGKTDQETCVDLCGPS